MNIRKSSFYVAIAIIAAFVLIAIFGIGNGVKGVMKMRFGIDIRGGVEAVYQPTGIKEKPTAAQLEAARTSIESRMDAKSIFDREVTIDKNAGNIIVRFPWKSDEKSFNPEQAISELGEAAKLTFRDEKGKIMVDGQDVSSSTVTKDPSTSETVVEITFNAKGTSDFAKATKKLVGKEMGIYMDEKEISSPIVQNEITEGKAIINHMESPAAARDLSEKINSGSLPFSLKTTNYSTISPSLGNDALKAMVTAGILAFFLVCIFMIVYYRLPGAVACLTMTFQMTLQLLALSVPQFTLTLPGIAGIILSLGMAVDANVIISERISEELRDGKSVGQAVKNGYKNAFSSVLDGNLTTAIVAAILMIFGSGTMLSFGYTLLTGVLVNIAVGVFFSKRMLSSLIMRPAFHKSTMFRPKKPTKIVRFSKGRRIVFGAAVVVIIAGSLISYFRGIELDTQFKGGAILRYTYEGEVDTDKVKSNVESLLNRATSVQLTENKATSRKELMLTMAGNGSMSPEQQKQVTESINKLGGAKYELSKTYIVEPYIGKTALKNSAIAIGLAALCIILYVWIRFSILSGLSAGISAIIALVHDVLMVLFVFGVVGIPLNDAFIAVTLTIIGYSINDTIVLYDRIRENMKKRKERGHVIELVDESISETMGRSINTSLTTIVCVGVVLIFSLIYNIDSIIVFALPMLVGLVSGCYSSVCIAGPLWSMWKQHKESGGK